jgi:hypothetical protein
LNVNYFCRRRGLELPPGLGSRHTFPARRSVEPRRCLDERRGGRREAGLHLQIQEITEQDWLVAVLARTSESQGSAKMVALGATSLAKVAHIARCAFIDGVCDERGSATEGCPKEAFLQVRQGCVAQTESALAARIRAITAPATSTWPRAQHALEGSLLPRVGPDEGPVVCQPCLDHGAMIVHPLVRVHDIAWKPVQQHL